VRPRPVVASVSFLALASIHAWWGAKMLLASNTMMGGSQLVAAGALVLAAVGVHSHRTLGFALALVGAATALRIPAIASDGFGPFAAATTILAAGYALAGWGALRLAEGRAAWEPLALRSGLLAVALGYAAFVGAGFASGNPPGAGLIDFAIRIGASIAAALYLDAPPSVRLARRGATALP
jgi:hypothetical protein